MKKFKGLMTSLSPHWATPKGLYATLNDEFAFDFDPCPLNSTFDGLGREWGRKNFVNPPYGRIIYTWVKRCFEVSQGGISRCVIAKPNRYKVVTRLRYESNRDPIY